MTNKELIAAAYDAGVEEEYNRLVSNPLFEAEFELITDLMNQYIANGSVVIDIGAGPGRYAEFLLKKNCKVGLVDLSQKSLAWFNDRINDKLRAGVLFSKVSCATDLAFVDDNIADAVFLMGPLYHLVNCEERTKAISEAFRILKNGGYLFAVFLSTFEPKHHDHDDKSPCCSDAVKDLLRDAVTTVEFQGYQVPQYKCLPQVAISSFEPHGLETLNIRNLEGIGNSYSEKDLQKYSDAILKKELIEQLLKNCENGEKEGLSNQFLYVGRKKLL